MIGNFFVSQTQDQNLQYVWFQQDGATWHTNETMKMLKELNNSIRVCGITRSRHFPLVYGFNICTGSEFNKKSLEESQKEDNDH